MRHVPRFLAPPAAAAFCAILAVATVAATLTVTPGWAQDRRVPASAGELRMSYAPVVKRVTPAVVNVYAAKTVINRNPLLEDPIFRRFFGMPGMGGPGEQVRLAGGCARAGEWGS